MVCNLARQGANGAKKQMQTKYHMHSLNKILNIKLRYYFTQGPKIGVRVVQKIDDTNRHHCIVDQVLPNLHIESIL